MVAIPQSGLLAQVSSLWLRSGHSGLILEKHCSPRLPAHCLLVVGAGVCAASPLGELPLGLSSVGFIYLFFLLLMLPCVLPRLTMAVRVFPGVWKLLSF